MNKVYFVKIANISYRKAVSYSDRGVLIGIPDYLLTGLSNILELRERIKEEIKIALLPEIKMEDKRMGYNDGQSFKLYFTIADIKSL